MKPTPSNDILTIIPARGGSKGVPGKNIRSLGGKPLLQWVFEAARRTSGLADIVVSTDSPDVADAAGKAGISVPFMRPAELAVDSTLLPEVAKHALDWFKDRGQFYKAVITLQPTCPFLSAATIDRAVDIWRRTGCDSVTSVAQSEGVHPYTVKRLGEDGSLTPFQPIPPGAKLGNRQTRDKAYYLTGGLYLRDATLFDREAIVPHFLGNTSMGVVVDEIEAVDINTELDFRFAEFLVHEGLPGRSNTTQEG